MSLEPCILEAKKWADENSGLKLKPSEIEQLGRMLEAAGGDKLQPAEQAALFQEQVLKKIEQTQLANRGENYLNALNHAKNANNHEKTVALWGDEANSRTEALEGLISGKSAKPGYGTNADPIAMSRAVFTQNLEALENALSPSDLKILKTTQRGSALGKAIDIELGALRAKTELGTSGNDMALRIAKGLREAQDIMFKETQSVNPYLRENELYLAARSWNSELVSKVSQEDFVKDIRAHYGKNIIGTDEQVNKFLGDFYKDVKSGLPPEGNGTNPRFWEPQGTSGSQALQSAGHRVLVANDALSENAMQAKYGDSHYNAFVRQAQRNAEYVATTDKWGTKPAVAYQRLWDATMKNATDEQKADLLANKTRLENLFKSTQASRYSPSWSIQERMAQINEQYAKNDPAFYKEVARMGAIKGSELMNKGLYMAQSGNHLPRTLTSGPAMIAQLRDSYGMNIFDHATAYARTVQAAFDSVGSAGSEEMSRLGVAHMSVQRDLLNRVAEGAGQELGAVAKTARVIGKLSLADYSTNVWKLAMAKNDAMGLASIAHIPFDELHPNAQELLHRYDLGDSKWDAARQSVTPDNRIMTPEGIKKISDEALGVSGQKAMMVRAELARRLGTLLNERASMAVGESNSATRFTAYGLAQPGSAEGIVRQSLWMFHQASMSRQQLLARTFRSGGGNTSNWSGAVQFALGAAFSGMVGQQIVELGAGREPLAVNDPKIKAHMLRSTGLFGFFGDMAADMMTSPEPSMAKRALEGDFLGPSFGTVLKGAEASAYTARGVGQTLEGRSSRDQYGGTQWARVIQQLTPGQNIFYLKGALDYTWFNEVHNFMGDQGYLGTLRQQMRQSKNLMGDKQGELLK